jgi:subtilisin family serine protease
MSLSPISMPWAAPGEHQYSSPGSLLLKARLGEAPESTPALLDVNQRTQAPATRLDGGPIDRIVRTLAGGLRAARLHPAAANATSRGKRHMGYDETEQLTGVARTFLLRVAPGAPIARLCERLSEVSSVESASPNYVSVTPFDLEAAVGDVDDAAWESRLMVRMAEALAYEPGDPSVLLGLIDSGIAANHAEFPEVFRAGYDTVRLHSYDVAPGIRLLGDYEHDDYNPTDRFVGHGMACAGIIAAAGLRMPAGLAGAARIIPMRALGAAKLPDKVQPVGLGAISDLDMAMKLAIDLGAKVINMSFGTDDRALHPSSPRPHAEVVEYALARGCILVAASGNNGSETRYWPAAYPEVIAVGAVDGEGRPAIFSTRGAHVALCAPGERVLTTALTGYQYATGTSFAAPFVSATAALLVSRAARRAAPLNGGTVKDILIRSARPFAEEMTSVGCGAGILDAAAALGLLDDFIDQSIEPDGDTYEH